MALALSSMSPGWQTFFYVVAVLAFLGVALVALTRRPPRPEWVLLGVGLAFFAAVFAYNALAAA